jgi:hypothetical protein
LKHEESPAVTVKNDQRAEERVNVALPVKLDNVTGITRDVSASGISFEVDAHLTAGSEINFVIEMEALDVKMLLKCKGSIIRTEARDGKNNVAVRKIESTMQAAN